MGRSFCATMYVGGTRGPVGGKSLSEVEEGLVDDGSQSLVVDRFWLTQDSAS